MSKFLELSGNRVEYVPDHLGGTACVPNGGTVSLVIPSGCETVFFQAEGGAGYYNVNAAGAGTLSHGYIPQNQTSMIFQCDNLGTVNVYAGAGVTVHTQYYSG